MGEDVSADDLLRRYASGERSFVSVNVADGSVLKKANLEGAIFQDGFFSDIDAREANFRGTTFRNMNLKCTDLRSADLTRAVFENVQIEHVAFRGAIVDDAIFRGMTFHGNEISDFQPDDWDWED